MVGSEKFNRAWSGAGNRNAGGTTKSSQDELYLKLRAYENRRRLSYSSKLESISLYWKSYCDLLSASLRETGRAHRIVLGTSHAYAMYAEAMQGIYEDTFLDEKGNILKDKQKRKKALALKKGVGGDSEKGKDIGQLKTTKAVSVLKEVREAQNDLASRFKESSKNMDEEIAELIGSLLNTTKESFDTIERLGSSILVELEKTEKEVIESYENYLNSRSEVAGDNTNEESSPKAVADPWVSAIKFEIKLEHFTCESEKVPAEQKK